MKVLALALLAVGSRSVGVDNVAAVVEAFQAELKAAKKDAVDRQRECDLAIRQHNKDIAKYGREQTAKAEEEQRQADSQAAYESKRDKLSDELAKATALHTSEAAGEAWDPTACDAEQAEYQGLLDAVTDAKKAVADKKPGLFLQLKALERVVGKDNMNTCMATIESSDTDCSSIKEEGECREAGCDWMVLYNYKSGGVMLALKNLHKQFSDEKHQHKMECENQKNAHNLAEDAKAGARANLADQMTNLETARDAADQDATTAKTAKTEAATAKDTAKTNKEDTETALRNKQQSCDTEMKTLSEQTEAILQVIPMLQALDENKHSAVHASATFLQIGHSVRRMSPAERVHASLQRFADKNPKADFAPIMSTLSAAITAGGVKKGAFTKVMGMINGMVDRLNQQVRDQNQAYEHCKTEFTSNFASFADASKKKTELEADMQALSTDMSDRDTAMADTRTAIADAKDAITDSTNENRETVHASKLMEMDATKCMETSDSAARIVKHFFSTTAGADSDGSKNTRLTSLLGAVDGLRAKCEGTRDESKLAAETSQKNHDQFVYDKNNEIKNAERLLGELEATQGAKKESHSNKVKATALLDRKKKGLNRFWNSLQKQCLPDNMWEDNQRPSEPKDMWSSVEEAYKTRKAALMKEIAALDSAHNTLADANV